MSTNAVETCPKVLFVAPIGKTTPEDGVFSYTAIDGPSDIELVESRSVVLFREDQADVLTTLGRNSGQSAPTVLPLLGVPGSNYDAWFDEATSGLDRVVYGPFVAELRAAALRRLRHVTQGSGHRPVN